MNTKFSIIVIVLLLAIGILSACSGMIPVTDGQQADPAAQGTRIVEAAQATATQMAVETELSRLSTQVAMLETQAAMPSATAVPATAAPEPTATATQVPPTATPVLPTPTATATPLPCNAAEFVADITVPDGSVLSPGAYFTKTWRLRNVGACAWTTAYDLVFIEGDSFSAPTVVDLPGDVYPGQVIDLSVGMVAPTRENNYRGYWKLRDASGLLFGVGGRSSTFFVDIRVAEPEHNDPLSFVARYCEAEWTSGAGRLPCQGENNDSRGVVRRIDTPTLESGYIDDEPVLMTQPQMITDGVIRGKYPAIRVESGYHFLAVIGCAYQAEACDVNFQLDYQIGNGAIQTLAAWHEYYDEQFQQVDVDLSGLAGHDVKFILTVYANGTWGQDRAQWLVPHIVKR